MLRMVHLYMLVYRIMNLEIFGAPFFCLGERSSNQANDKSALTKAAPPAVPPDCVSYNTKGACCPSLVAWWKRDLVAWICLSLKEVSMSPGRDLTDLESRKEQGPHTNLISLQSEKAYNKFQLQASPMWLRLVIRIFLWASKSLHLGGRFSMLRRQTLRYTETCFIEWYIYMLFVENIVGRTECWQI